MWKSLAKYLSWDRYSVSIPLCVGGWAVWVCAWGEGVRIVTGVGQIKPEVILKHTLHKLSTTQLTYLKITYLINLGVYNPKSRWYQKSFPIRKMGIIHVVIKGNQVIPWVDQPIIPFLIEQKAPNKYLTPFVQMFHWIMAKKVQHVKQHE